MATSSSAAGSLLARCSGDLVCRRSASSAARRGVVRCQQNRLAGRGLLGIHSKSSSESSRSFAASAVFSNKRFTTREHRRTPVKCRAAAEAGGDSSSSSSSDTLNALENLLGKDEPVEAEVLDPLDGDSDEAARITVPLLWMGGARQGQGQPGLGGVAAALTGPSGGAPSSSSAPEYIAITLGLPDRATKQQQERGVKGVELDFMLDTACTTNFIIPTVAYGLDMQIIGTTPAGMGATGTVAGGSEMLLGTCKLGSDRREDADGVIAVTGLSAAVVSVPCAPGTAGIVGRSFFNLFGACAFDWGTRPGTLSFYQEYDWEDGGGDGLTAVDLEELSCGLLAVQVRINGVDMPALLDTGAPTTIFNGAAAEAAGLSLEAPSSEAEEASARAEAGGGGGGMNPFSGLMKAFKRGQESALRDKGVMVMGAGGVPERLEKVPAGGITLEVAGVPLALGQDVLVGEMAAFSAGLGLPQDGPAPGILLGLDALSSRPRVVLGTAERKMRI